MARPAHIAYRALSPSAAGEDSEEDVDAPRRSTGVWALAARTMLRRTTNPLAAGVLLAGGLVGVLCGVHLGGKGLDEPTAFVPAQPGGVTDKDFDAIAEEAFADVRGLGTHFNVDARGLVLGAGGGDGQGTKDSELAKTEDVWKECGKIDWTKVSENWSKGKKAPQFRTVLKEMHLDTCVDTTSDKYSDPTCHAVRALINTSLGLMRRFPQGPIFANYSLVSWGEHPSWVQGAVEGLDYTTGEMPPHARLEDPNGVVGYAMCDIIRTIVTESVDQMSTGTCSWVASLAALSHKAPAVALKIALRLLWTGRLTMGSQRACPAVFRQQPGLIPFQDGSAAWVPPAYTPAPGVKAGCSGNAADCASATGKPAQPAGLTFMWSQSLMSMWHAQNYGSCPESGSRVGLSYPGAPESVAKQNELAQGGAEASMMWECRQVLDTSGETCKMVLNPRVCQELEVDDVEQCIDLVAVFPSLLLLMEVMPKCEKGPSTDFAGCMIRESHSPVMPGFFDTINRTWPGKPITAELLNNYSDKVSHATGYPSFTQAELNQACKARVSLLSIASQVLSTPLDQMQSMLEKAKQEQAEGKELDPFFEKCNHIVYLYGCDHEANEYTIWTWGGRVKLPREMITGPSNMTVKRDVPGPWNWGSVCSAITADKITFGTEADMQVDCIGGERTCSGNECCPASVATGNKALPCPSADPGWNGCVETPPWLVA